jgi:hypothetical protein
MRGNHESQRVMSTRRLKGHPFVMKGFLGIFLILFIASGAWAEKWSKQYIQHLPDSAFAAIEITKDGKKIRHLPHHNLEGEVDINHLKSALSRVHQVKWMDPANFAKAKEHLEQHYQDYKLKRTATGGK